MKAVKFIKIFIFSVFVFSVNTGVANAALITGGVGITGSYTLDGATLFTLDTATGTSGDGILGTTVGFATGGTVNNGTLNIASFTPVVNVLSIANWQLNMDTLVDETTTGGLWKFTGTGLLVDLNGTYEDTAATFALSANQTGSSYSLSIAAVPVPAAVWLFGSGLLGLVGVARRKA